MKRILIIKTSAIGDVVQSLPVLNYLKNLFPDCAIDWVVEKAAHSLLAAHPYIHNAHLIDTRSWKKYLFSRKTLHEILAVIRTIRSRRYDLIFDLQGNIKSGVGTLLARGKEKVGFGIKTVAEKPNLLATGYRYNPQSLNRSIFYLELMESHLVKCHGVSSQLSNEKKTLSFQLLAEEKEKSAHIVTDWSQKVLNGVPILIAFGSNWINKRATIGFWIHLLKLIEERLNPRFLFIFKGDEEKNEGRKLLEAFPERGLLVGDLSLPVVAALMAHAELVLSVDSALLHLAGTIGTPSFSLFGPSSALVYKPLGDQHGCYQGSCPYEQTFEKRCALLRSCSTGACIKELDAEKIFRAFSNWLDSLNGNR